MMNVIIISHTRKINMVFTVDKVSRYVNVAVSGYPHKKIWTLVDNGYLSLVKWW